MSLSFHPVPFDPKVGIAALVPVARRAVACAALLVLAACSKPEAPAATAATAATTAPTVVATASSAAPAPAPTDAHGAHGIAWRAASNDAEVDAAFAAARSENKPVFVYWGAKWCPPCNQVKATLFNRQDFIERSRAFVPVYVDGDSPGAQKLGARFNVSGYPTMVLFSPKGAELTRLPGEVTPERYTQVLTLGMNADRPVREVLGDALGSADARRTLTPNDWRLLAFYAWDVDEQQVVPKARIPATLAQLADACPPDEHDAATRLRLKALAAIEAPAGKVVAAAPPAARPAVLQVLADPEASRRYLDVLTNNAADVVRALAPKDGPERRELLPAFDTALQRFEADASLSRADRIAALIARVDLATLDAPKRQGAASASPPPRLPDALLADIRDRTAAADREITDGYERQAVITACAYLLEQAGLGAESDALLKANLAKSHSPYYLMSELASNAKARGDSAEALHWYGEAFAKSEGPATRLQWGSSYLNALVDLAPRDEAKIEQVAGQVFTEAGQQPDAFYERSGRSLQRVGAKLAAWNKGGAHAAVLKRLQTQLDGVCGALPAEDPKRAACQSLLKPAPAKASA